MTTEIQGKVVNHSLTVVLIIAGFVMLASSSHKSDKEEENEAELEHKARVWIDALLDRVAEKHIQERQDFQKSLESGEIQIE